MSNGPISVTTTNGSVAIEGRATGTPALPLPGRVKAGLFGTSDDGIGVHGQSAGIGVTGESITQTVPPRPGSSDGVFGSSGNNGVHGLSFSASASGVWGQNDAGGYGVSGSTNSPFVAGPDGMAGVWGNNSDSGTGVKGTSQGGDAVAGFSHSNAHAGVAAMRGRACGARPEQALPQAYGCGLEVRNTEHRP
jgi:hypothetical protein